jgi:hypothetical protein
MGFDLRTAVIAFAFTSASLVSSPSWAGDDGDAPLWKGVGSIFGPVLGPAVGFGFGGEKPPPIDYREHGKLVLPPNSELPPPSASAPADPAWPVNQEIVRRKALKEDGKKSIAGGWRCAPALHSRVPGERARHRSIHHSGRTNGEVRRQLRIELIGARQPQPTELGRNGKIEYGSWS